MADSAKTESFILKASGQRSGEILHKGWRSIGLVEDLRKINAYIFQDAPADPHYRPVVLRKCDLHPGQWWTKIRRIESFDIHDFIVYSGMEKQDLEDLDEILRDASDYDPMNKEDFVGFVSSSYARLDYIHPFYDGNSRTLRAYTRLLGQDPFTKLVCQKESRSDRFFFREAYRRNPQKMSRRQCSSPRRKV